MHTDEDDCGWEEIYQSYGVRCDTDNEISSLGETGVCPTPLANLFSIPIFFCNSPFGYFIRSRIPVPVDRL